MSDDIYQDRFVGVTPAWHRKGTLIRAGADATEAMAAAGQADWDVRAIPLQLDGIDCRELFVLIRNDDAVVRVASDTLVTAEYTPISNEEVFGPMIELMTGLNLTVDAAGVLGRLGNRAFMTFRADPIEIAEGERFQAYLVALSRHTGRDSDYLMPTGIRVVCANTEAFALRTARRLLTIPHTRVGIESFYENAGAARNVLGLTEHYEQALRRQFDRLTGYEFDSRDWSAATDLFIATRPIPDTPRKQTMQEVMRDRLMVAWRLEEERAAKAGQPNTTLWTAKQAVSTWAQHTSSGGITRHDSRSMRLALGEPVPLVDDMHAKVVTAFRIKVDEHRYQTDKVGIERALSWLGAAQ